MLRVCLQVLFPSVNKYLWSTYYVPDAVLEATVENRENGPYLAGARVPAGAEGA